MECKDVEWAAFLFNAIGEDESYIIRLDEVQKGIKGKQTLDDTVLCEIINFLNEWRSRANRKNVHNGIKEWYKEKSNQLDTLPPSLLGADFEDNNTAGSIKDIYRAIIKKDYIGDTIASKVLHIIKPDFFVPWDSVIKEWYNPQINPADNKKIDSAEQYLYFLKEMQKDAKSLIKQNEMFIKELNSKVLDLYKGNLEQAENNKLKLSGAWESMKKNIDDYNKMIKFMENPGKTMAKYLDEYNWITITNAVKVKPEWYPD